MGNHMETGVQHGLSRDLRKQIMPTLGPKVGSCYLGLGIPSGAEFPPSTIALWDP